MKLYATATSERASKGQGGNKFLDIVVTDDNKEILAKISFVPFTDKVGDGIKALYSFNPRVYASETGLAKTKGNKQKGECKKCNRIHAEKCSHGIDWHTICNDCIPF